MIRETKVGIFAVCVIALVVVMSATLKDFSPFGSKGMKVTFYVNDAAGIVPSSNVRYMGIDVGKVKKVSLRNGMVAIDTVIDEVFQIPNNVTVVIAQDGLLGAKFIDLSPKTTIESTGYLMHNGEYFNFKPPVSLDDLTEKIENIADQVTVFTAALNSTFATDEGKSNMKAIVENLRVSTDSLKVILTSNQDEIHNIVRNLDNLTGVLERASRGKEDDITDIIDNINAMSANMKNFSENLDKLLSKEQGDLSASISNIKELTEKAKITVDNINQITTDVNDGKGTLGMLVSDNETKDQLKDVLAILHTTTTKADRLIIELEAGLQNLTATGDYRGRFDLKIRPGGSRYYLFGVGNNPAGVTTKSTERFIVTDHNDPSNNRDFTEKREKTVSDPLVFSLQYAMIFQDKYTIRAGVFDSRLGAALDYKPLKEHDFYLTFEASDFFRERYGTYAAVNAKYYFHKNFFIQTGWDDFLSSRSSYSIGGGVNILDDDLKYVIGSVPVGAIAK